MKRYFLIALISIFTFTASGCSKKPTDPQDPYESYNRFMYGFNTAVDHLVYRPVAHTYQAVIPNPIRKGVTNAFNNLGEITSFPNDIVQGKIHYAAVDLCRFVVNSVFGIGGLFDVASRIGLPKHYNDFGLTLAYYSDTKKSPYFMIPFFGPSTFRDAVSLPVDAYVGPWPYFHSDAMIYSLIALKYVDIRAQLLTSDELVDTSFDPYALVRSAYLQHRAKQIAHNQHDLPPVFGPHAAQQTPTDEDTSSDVNDPSIMPETGQPSSNTTDDTNQDGDNLDDANELLSYLKNEPAEINQIKPKLPTLFAARHIPHTF